ncbi:MAG: hypothetical protein IIB16_09130 [Chloroflexi bacterium]|nr:hypothetical protein [Chloroflexota bacterium]
MTWAAKSAIYILLVVFAVAACVREIPREVTPPVAFTATAQPAIATATAVVSAPVPTATSVALPTNTPVVIDTPVVVQTPVPTATTAPRPTATPEPTGSLQLDVRGPEDGATVQTDGVVVHGIASRGADVKINGLPAELDENGRFSAQVDLTPGDNEILVTASNGAEQTSETIHITSFVLPPQPFFLLVTQPADQSIVSAAQIPVAGRTIPGAVVSVNGVSVPVDAVGIYTTVLALQQGPNIIDVLATNVDGEVLSTIIAIIHRP